MPEEIRYCTCKNKLHYQDVYKGITCNQCGKEWGALYSNPEDKIPELEEINHCIECNCECGCHPCHHTSLELENILRDFEKKFSNVGWIPEHKQRIIDFIRSTYLLGKEAGKKGVFQELKDEVKIINQ